MMKKVFCAPAAIITVLSGLFCPAESRGSCCTDACPVREAAIPVCFSNRRDVGSNGLDISDLDKKKLQFLLADFANNSARLRIRGLTCENNANVDAEILRKITATFPNLEELNLSNCPALARDDLKIIGALSGLKTLDISLTDMSSNALATIACGIRGLEHLALCSCFLSPDSTAVIEKFTNLRCLHLENIAIGEEGFAAIAHLSGLEGLFLHQITITKKNLELIADKIRGLSILLLDSCSGLSSDDHATIARFPHLKQLLLTETPINRFSLTEIANKNKSLELLCLLGCQQLGTEDFAPISHLTKLEALLIDNANIGDRSLAAITSNVKGLRRLWLRGCSQLSPEGFVAVANLANLKIFGAAYSNIGDRALIAIANKIRGVETLDIRRCEHIGESGFAAIGKFTYLKKLVAWGTRITAHAIDQIRAHNPDIDIDAYPILRREAAPAALCTSSPLPKTPEK